MPADRRFPLRVSVAALYLPGLPRPALPSSRGVGAIVDRLARGEGPDELRRIGAVAEALCLDDHSLLDSALEARFLAFCDPEYSEGWRRLDRPPGALWLAGDDPPPGPWTGGVGSRRVSDEVLDWCREVAAIAATPTVSGGAAGCDLAFASGATRAVHVLPRGLVGDAPDRVTLLSPFAPGTEFSGANAMARNRLIYAAAEVVAIGHVRPREGGTWHGAVGAIRERLAPLVVRDDPSSAALIALGAVSCRDPGNFPAGRAEALARRAGLFGTLSP